MPSFSHFSPLSLLFRLFLIISHKISFSSLLCARLTNSTSSHIFPLFFLCPFSLFSFAAMPSLLSLLSLAHLSLICVWGRNFILRQEKLCCFPSLSPSHVHIEVSLSRANKNSLTPVFYLSAPPMISSKVSGHNWINKIKSSFLCSFLYIFLQKLSHEDRMMIFHSNKR